MIRLARRIAGRTTAPAVDALTVAREIFGRSGGWMRHRGVLVVHAGVLVDQPMIAKVVDFVVGEVTRRTDQHRAAEIVARTVVIMRPGDVVDFAGAQYAHNAVEYPGPVVRRGVVTVAAGSPEWARAMARGLSQLWGERAGIARHEPVREWTQ